MDGDRAGKENERLNVTPGPPGAGHGTPTTSTSMRNTPIRPLTAAYMAARNEHEVRAESGWHRF